ncbi:MAG: aspartate kinase [Candidatus Woesearchaeota archaeon]|jgi:aspartate kinase
MNTTNVVYKFGGTSQGTVDAINQSASILANDPAKKIVVVSAPSGITDLLIASSAQVTNSNYFPTEINQIISSRFHELYDSVPSASNIIDNYMSNLGKYIQTKINTNINSANDIEKLKVAARIQSTGEDLESTLFSHFLNHLGLNSSKMPQDLIRLKGNYLEASFNRIADNPIRTFMETSTQITVVGGFYGFNNSQDHMLLGRGASDLTQTELMRITNASHGFNCTDVNGIKMIDPRLLDNQERVNTPTILNLNYAQTQELSRQGAKVLHPRCIEPLKENNIPLYVMNTFDPTGHMTKISNITTNRLKENSKLLAVTGKKESFVTITLNSGNMEGRSGYLASFASAFKDVDLDIITTSAVEISASFHDKYSKANTIKNKLSTLGDVSVNNSTALLAIVGDHLDLEPKLTGDFFNLMSQENIPVQQITKSNNNSLWVSIPSTKYEQALIAVYKNLLHTNK